MRAPDPLAEIALMATAVLLAFAATAVLPPVDLWMSAEFYQRESGTWIGAVPWAETLRNTQWNLSILLVVIAAAALLWTLIRGRRIAGLDWRIWAFVLVLYTLASGVLVNGLLKSHWGRARPASIVEFGGTAEFSLPYQIADQCQRNCSFVSGEVTAAMIFAISVLVILRHGPSLPRTGWLLSLIAVAFPLVNAAQRITSGRHFLTDTLFAALFTLIVARLLWWGLGLVKRPPSRS